MKHWYIFTTVAGADIYNPANYFGPVLEQSKGDGSRKLCAIYAEDTGQNRPVIDSQTLTEDFIKAVNGSKNSGIVILHKKFLKHESWLERQINRLIKIL